MAGGIDRVRAQYEVYPYPSRNPDDEARRLVVGSPSHLAEIEHYCFAGRLPRPFRALVAGGGTGDGLVMLAQQLHTRGIEAEVTYLDLSVAARSVAEARIARRGLRNVRFVTGSLLEVARLAPGPFHYVDCCGVLHHLPDPDAGLLALVSVLAPDGALGLMLYGELGRTGVYPMQRALRLLAADLPPAEQVRLARRLLGGLPESNWLRRNPFLGDRQSESDADLYDLLLHSLDRAYRVPQILALLETAGLSLAAFIEPAKYEPATWIGDTVILERSARLPEADRWALAEDVAGAMKSHVFYAVRRARAGRSVARADAPDAIPVLREIQPAAIARTLARGGHLKVALDGRELRLPIPDGTAEIVAAIDGRRTSGEIARLLKLDQAEHAARFARLSALLGPLNLLLCRY
ncbi:MAG: class I SAM-dependent methyltransferase [Alphaproteobacteria bacterium]|nr:class I SAM-dependent methyltransferase [Alphaproteobacteria bacterium]